MVYEEDTSEADGLPDPDKENIGEEDLNVQEEIEDLEAKNTKEIKPESGERDSVWNDTNDDKSNSNNIIKQAQLSTD